jgi:hypothetical protein
MANLIDVEVIDLNELDLHASPRWTPTAMIYDNDLE